MALLSAPKFTMLTPRTPGCAFYYGWPSLQSLNKSPREPQASLWLRYAARYVMLDLVPRRRANVWFIVTWNRSDCSALQQALHRMPTT
eukprot:363154-Chlamydomonas_euryale.AAC.2